MSLPTKTVGAKRFLASTHRVTPEKIAALAEPTLGALFQAAEKAGMLAPGPVEFHYQDWDPATMEMTLHMCVPLTAAGKAVAPFTLREVPAAKMATREYAGPITGLMQAWEQFYGAVGRAGLSMTGESREVYVHWVGQDSPANRVELQIRVS